MKVVFDTNVYISALTSHNSKAEEAYLFAIEGKIELYTSVAILTETAKKLREKFLWEDNNITDALKHISKVATVLKPRKHLNILQDAPDNRILECATEANADLIITGDKHLLDLKQYQGISVTTISALLYSLIRDNL
ncbi:MAG: putative toxin-antitoxin system toxin component, PIN family [Nitrospiraceae bacterium]|nr:MAG: putative toxin-antitoxin system toxin component, PIN family [Nitrospiraceae bacterium]